MNIIQYRSVNRVEINLVTLTIYLDLIYYGITKGAVIKQPLLYSILEIDYLNLFNLHKF